MRREGSPFSGLGTVFLKELSDHLTSARMLVLLLLVVFMAVLSVYNAVQQLKESTAEDPYLFLRLFTVTREQYPLPSFVSFLGFLAPLMAIGLGFDAVNSEHSRRTLSRILAQPIYRDALLFGKFLAGLVTLSISFVALWLLVIGWGVLALGLPPGGEEMARAFVFLLMTIAFAGVWLFMTVIWSALAPALAAAFIPPDPRYAALGLPTPETTELQTVLSRVSPNTLFSEIVLALLDPTTRALGPIYLSQLQGAVVGTPLPLAESVIMAVPQMVGLIAGTIVLFVIGYVVFQRQEVRA